MTDPSPSPCTAHISTQAMHAGEMRPKPYHALVDPIFQTATFTFEKMADVIEYEQSHVDGQPIDRFEYGRYGNPSISAAEARLAALEGAQSAIQVELRAWPPSPSPCCTCCPPAATW